MIVVRIWWNTDHEGNWVDASVLVPDAIDTPQGIYGPFDSMEDANDWMAYGYPDDDADVWDMSAHSDFVPPKDWHVNHPSVIFGGEEALGWLEYVESRNSRKIQAS